MLDRHTLGITMFGAATAAATAVASVPTVIGQAASGTTELGPVITGGGALSLTAVLGFIAIKLARGELVPRDVAKVEQALLRLVENSEEREDAWRQTASSNAELTREVITELATSRAARGAGPYHRPGDPT